MLKLVLATMLFSYKLDRILETEARAFMYPEYRSTLLLGRLRYVNPSRSRPGRCCMLINLDIYRY